jgi:hypothetical protein
MSIITFINPSIGLTVPCPACRINLMKTFFAKVLLLLGLYAGWLGMQFSIAHPSMPRNAQWFGFSWFRLGLMGADLAWVILIGALTVRAFVDKPWLQAVIGGIETSLQDEGVAPAQGSDQIEAGKISFKRAWIQEAVLSVLTVAVFTPVIFAMVVLIPNSDYASHLTWAEQLRQAVHPDVPLDVIAHSGWQFLVIFFQAITQASFPVAGVLATLAGILLMALVLFHWIKPALVRQNLSLWWGVGIALALNLVTPVFLLALLDGKRYFGYLGMTTYHNPTIILLRPFAILQFIYTVRAFQERSSTWRQVSLTALISLLATYIKPVFAICILPAIGILMAYRLLKKQELNWKILSLGLILPTVVVLAWQYMLTYQASGSGGIIFAPFSVMRLYSKWLTAKFLLSILFPLFVTVFYFSKARRDMGMILGWLIFLMSVVCTYFLSESGTSLNSGNFTWTAEISLLVLFCVCTLFFIEQVKVNRIKSFVLKWTWAAHVVAGIIYYYFCFVVRSYL